MYDLTEPIILFFYFFVALNITMMNYGGFPIIFALTIKQLITEKRYKKFCRLINLASGPSGAYFLWTWVFSKIGINILKKRGKLVFDESIANNPNYIKEKGVSHTCKCGVRFYGDTCHNCGRTLKDLPIKSKPVCQNCGAELIENKPFCHICGTRVVSSFQAVKTTPYQTSRICKCGERFYGDTCPNCGRNLNDL